MNKTAFCLLMTVLVPTISLCALESTARFRQMAGAHDTARVARPAIQLHAETDPAGLAAVRSGESGIFEFSITNEDLIGLSEVRQTYSLEISQTGAASGLLTCALFFLDAQGQPQPVIPDEDGRFAGWQPMGLLPDTHHYRLVFTFPAGSEAPAEPANISIEVVATAVQTDA